jgi:hypothetical protein
MIDVKEAAKVAVEYLQSLPNMPAVAVRLEEVILTDNEQFWLITLSFMDDAEPRGIAAIANAPERLYKAFNIDAESGQVRSMKIRQLEGA